MMFKDKYIHKLYAFGLAAVFALTLAGCGGGGGTAQMPDPEPPAMPDPTPQETCEADGGRYNADGSCTSAEDLAAEMTEAEALMAAQEAAMAAYMAAAAAVAGAKDPVAASNAQMYAGMAMEASGMAADAETSEMAMEYQAQAEIYRDMAMEAGMTRGLSITKAANAAANKRAIDTAELIGTAPPSAVSNASRVGAALKSAAGAATATVAGVDTDSTATTGDSAGLDTLSTINQGNFNDATPPAQDGQVTVSVRHTGSAPRFTVNGVLASDSASPVNVLRRGEAPTALVTRGGWPGADLVGTDDGPNDATDTSDDSKNYAIVFTDINPPTLDYRTSGTGFISTATFEAATDNAHIDKSVITGDIPGDGSHFAATINVDPTDNNPPVSGRFFCGTGENCAISVNSAGVITAITGYAFQPAIPNSQKGDSDYLAWGIWAKIPNAVPTAAAPAAATVNAFASGNKPFVVKSALSGTATYNGVASGLYSAGGMVEYFDADASLSVDFGDHRAGVDSDPTDNTSDTRLLGAVTGMISNLKAGGMDIAGSLTLGRAKVLTDATDGTGDSTGGFNGATGGVLGGTAMSGAWGGQFYGSSTAAGVAARSQYPTTAAGTFGANSVVGPPVSILGSFGAWKAD